MSDLTVRDIADDLKASVWTVQKYLRDRVIPGGYQPVAGGEWRVPEEDYREWKRTRQQAAVISDPYRIEPRSARSVAARNRKASR